MGRSWRFVSTVLKIIFRHPILGVTLIPILPDGKIVLARRADTKQWSLPGGMVDWGQNIVKTAHRELKEETGLYIVKIKGISGVYSSPRRDPRIHSISITLEVQVDGVLNIEDSLEILEVKGFSISELPIGTLAHDHDIQLQNYLAGIVAID